MPELELDTVFEADENRVSSEAESSSNQHHPGSAATQNVNGNGSAKRPSGPTLIPPSLSEAKQTMKQNEEST